MNPLQVPASLKPHRSADPLTEAERSELFALKAEIDGSPQSASVDQQERFTELLVKSLQGKGDLSLSLSDSPHTTPLNR